MAAHRMTGMNASDEETQKLFQKVRLPATNNSMFNRGVNSTS